LERVTREKLAEELKTPETWASALRFTGTDPNEPGADYEGMKKFFEGGQYNLVAETEWYIEKAFQDADQILSALRQNPTEWLISGVGKGPAVSLHCAV
jgi:hypothetical protein